MMGNEGLANVLESFPRVGWQILPFTKGGKPLVCEFVVKDVRQMA